MVREVDHLLRENHFRVDDTCIHRVKFLQQPHARNTMYGRYRKGYAREVRRLEGQHLGANIGFIEIGKALTNLVAHGRTVAFIYLIIITEIVLLEYLIHRFATQTAEDLIVIIKSVDAGFATVKALDLFAGFGGHRRRDWKNQANLFREFNTGVENNQFKR